MKNRANDERVTIVLELVVCGLQRRQIAEQIEKKFPDWKVSIRTLSRYIKNAHTALEREAKPIRERELGKAIRRLDLLFARCLQITDFKAALAVERERIQLLNLSHTWPMTYARPSALPTVTPFRREPASVQTNAAAAR